MKRRDVLKLPVVAGVAPALIPSHAASAPMHIHDLTERMRPFLKGKARDIKREEPVGSESSYVRAEEGRNVKVDGGLMMSDGGVVRYLAKVMQMNRSNGFIPLDQLQQFADMVNWLMGAGLITGIALAPPVAMQLAALPEQEHRGLVAWYLSSNYTMEKLNEHCGVEAFVEEGGLGLADWSGSVLDMGPL